MRRDGKSKRELTIAARTRSAALLDGGVGQADDVERRRRGDDVRLDLHRVALKARQRLTGDAREHPSPFARP